MARYLFAPFGNAVEHYVTQRFGENPEDYPVTGGHNGIDFACEVGTPLFAPITGTVMMAGPDPNGKRFNGGYGTHVRIKSSEGGVVILAHMSSIEGAIHVGSRVNVGTLMGVSGNTGWSTGPHLHLEWRPNGVRAVDPEPLLTMEIALANGGILPDDPAPVTTPPPVVDQPIDLNREHVVTAQLGLKLREAPGVRGQMIQILPLGSIVKPTGKTVVIDGYTWMPVCVTTVVNGFVAVRDNSDGENYVS